MANKYLTIDNVMYPVKIVDLNRTADVLDASAYRTEDGILHRKVIGTYYNYQVKVGIENDIALYESLYNVLSSPVASHSIKFPNESAPLQRYVSSVTDGILRVTENGTIYRDLSFRAICVAPSRRAR